MKDPNCGSVIASETLFDSKQLIASSHSLLHTFTFNSFCFIGSRLRGTSCLLFLRFHPACLKSISSRSHGETVLSSFGLVFAQVSVEHKRSWLDALECFASGGRRSAAMDCSALISEQHLVRVFYHARPPLSVPKPSIPTDFVLRS